jgi:Mg2+ and Co2+ transporter CorA
MEWLRSMLSDGTNNSVSSKRVITLLAFLLCSGGFIASLYGIHVDNKLYDSMMYIVLAGLGFTASEKFAPK